MTVIYASAESEITAQFYDLDPMNIVWHGNYARYFEIARCALLDKIGYNYAEMSASGFIWPIVDMHVRYIKPISFDQKVNVRADLVEHEFRLKILYTLTDKQDGHRICKGHTCQVAVDEKSRELQLKSPSILFEKIESAP